MRRSPPLSATRKSRPNGCRPSTRLPIRAPGGAGSLRSISTDLRYILISLAVIVPSIILHEVSHGVVALWFGDDTAKRAGRITLNPVAHVDPFGTLLLPLILAAFGGAILGYAKPVPIDPRRMRHPRNDAVLVALAGPAVNIVLAVMAALVLRRWGPDIDSSLLRDILIRLGVLNAILAAFNLIPVPPLD